MKVSEPLPYTLYHLKQLGTGWSIYSYIEFIQLVFFVGCPRHLRPFMLLLCAQELLRPDVSVEVLDDVGCHCSSLGP